jgi:hypothetical protein
MHSQLQFIILTCSAIYPVLWLLRPATEFIKKAESFHHFHGLTKCLFFLLDDILLSFLILSDLILSIYSFQFYLLSVIGGNCNIVTISSFLLWCGKLYPKVILIKHISEIWNLCLHFHFL